MRHIEGTGGKHRSSGKPAAHAHEEAALLRRALGLVQGLGVLDDLQAKTAAQPG